MSDHAVYEQLRQILPRLRRFAHWLTKGAGGADDLVQSTLDRAHGSPFLWVTLSSHAGEPRTGQLAPPFTFRHSLERVPHKAQHYRGRTPPHVAVMRGITLHSTLESRCRASPERGSPIRFGIGLSIRRSELLEALAASLKSRCRASPEERSPIKLEIVLGSCGHDSLEGLDVPRETRARDELC
jgi:hypothetical protein